MATQTLTIELKNNLALKLLEDLENLNVIRILKKPKVAKSSDLASRMAVSLSGEQADEMQRELERMRSEWERDI
jgi:hypothetical protein